MLEYVCVCRNRQDCAGSTLSAHYRVTVCRALHHQSRQAQLFQYLPWTNVTNLCQVWCNANYYRPGGEQVDHIVRTVSQYVLFALALRRPVDALLADVETLQPLHFRSER